MGGPDPLTPEGGNIITSLHVGKTKGGRDFADVYSSFEGEVVQAYGEFLSKVFDNDGSESKKCPLGQPASGSGDNITSTDDDVDEEDAEEDLGCNGRVVGHNDLDAEGEDDVELGEGGDNIELGDGAREQRDEERVEWQPNSPSTSSYSTPDATQVTTGVARPPVADASSPSPPTAHLATPPSANPSVPPSAHLATPSITHLAPPPSTHLATPSIAHLASPPSAHLAPPPSAHLAPPPSAHLATPSIAHLTALSVDPVQVASSPPTDHFATRAQDVSASDGLGMPAMQGFQTSFVDLLGNDLASFGMGMGFDTWCDPFAIPQVPLPGVGLTVPDPGLHAPLSADTVSPMDLSLTSSPCDPLQGQPVWDNTVGMHPLPASFQPVNQYASGTTFTSSNLPNFDFSAVGSVGGFNPGYYPSFTPPNFNFGGVPNNATTPENQYSTPLSTLLSPTLSLSQSTSIAPLAQPLSEVTVPPAPLLPPTEPGVVNVPIPQTQMTKTSSEDGIGARSKRKRMRSLRAERDNAIGKENQAPTPAVGTTRDRTNKPKRGRPSDAGAASSLKNKKRKVT
ncbi:hypothetical protein JVT61DRAFT_11596 [Boletus reticuloceps]|nr:hypothetical protein JVT61DRAFT_11596 [Boletus reticuloceps]